jgi:hypothetical protein
MAVGLEFLRAGLVRQAAAIEPFSRAVRRALHEMMRC